MYPDLFLAYYADPFSLDDPVFAIKQSGIDVPHLVSASQLEDVKGRIFTFQADRLIDALRLRSLPSIELVDLRQALQLASGLSKRNYEASSWVFSKWLRLTHLSSSERGLYLALINGEIVRPDQNVLVDMLLAVSVAMEDVWRGVSEELEQLGELARFTDVEIPVQQLLHKRQWRGIAVDTKKSEEFLQAAKNDKYSSMLKVGTQLKINPTGLTYKTILPYLGNTDASGLQKLSETKGLASYFKITADHSDIARDFRTMLQANRNIKALLALAVSDNRAYPTFDALGTVTARVQVSHPHLQQLRKVYRGALTPDRGMNASYLDYAQFEPGILAQFVGPGRFRDLYNSGDVYAALSRAVFGDHHKREIAKQIFIAFCYGMELSSIGRLLGSTGQDSGVRYALAVSLFFEEFPELDAYKRYCEKKLAQEGSMSSAFGNRRIRLQTGPLTRKEKGWAMNQSIQGTGSLIFKEALLALARRFGDESILLPVHDAVWLQVSQDKMTVDELNEAATAEMRGSFERWCPDVRIRIKASGFE